MAGQRVELPAYSMFATTPVYEVGGEIVFGLMKDVIVPDPSDTLYTVGPADVPRLDLISYRFYGTPALWWVIARVNDIVDALSGIPLNTQIRIPTKARLASEGILNV
jgi:nucleoid-associated protein YgaU